MKQEDLMLHDWVLHDGEPYQIRQLGIYGVDRDGEDYPAVCVGKPKGIGLIVERDEISPIPLTAEILEKNGFVEFTPDNWQIVIGNIMIELRSPEHNMVIWLDWDEHDTGTYASYMFPRPNCVHELQHVFKLCGINKEIKLS